MGTLVGGLILLVNGITVAAGLGGLPAGLGWTLAIGLLAATGVTAVKAWGRERRASAASVPA
jgi:hypothetical protein